MAALRVTQLAYGAITGTTITTVYTVPTGKRIVLRQISLLEVSGSACIVQLRLAALGTWGIVNLAAYSSSAAFVVTPLWNVFNAGDVLQLGRSNAGTISYTLSGSLYFV